MPEEQQQEKTEPATPKRRQETREKGNVAKSIEFNSAFILLIGMLFFYFAGGWLMNNTRYIMQIIFENAGSVVINADNVQGYLVLAVGTVFRILGPVFGVFLVRFRVVIWANGYPAGVFTENRQLPNCRNAM